MHVGWCRRRTSNPVCPAYGGIGGFDSHTLPPIFFFLVYTNSHSPLKSDNFFPCWNSANAHVQGIGFRPYIYNLATKLSLSAFVQNNTRCIFIDVEGCDNAVDKFRDRKGINDVVLSGGVFQNNFLLSLLVKKLQLQGFTMYTHKKVRCNDGGISLGQAVIAGERSKTCV